MDDLDHFPHLFIYLFIYSILGYVVMLHFGAFQYSLKFLGREPSILDSIKYSSRDFVVHNQVALIPGQGHITQCFDMLISIHVLMA